MNDVLRLVKDYYINGKGEYTSTRKKHYLDFYFMLTDKWITISMVELWENKYIYTYMRITVRFSCHDPIVILSKEPVSDIISIYDYFKALDKAFKTIKWCVNHKIIPRLYRPPNGPMYIKLLNKTESLYLVLLFWNSWIHSWTPVI